MQCIKKEAKVFITGVARSGTTLLSEILSNHSELAITHETHYFRKYWNKNSNVNQTLFKSFLSSPEFAQFGFSEEEINFIKKQVSDNQKDIVDGTIFDLIGSKFINKKKKKYWGEKTPSHHLHIPLIATLFPDAKFICIIRDPRDICLSLKKVPFNTGSPISIARRWKRYIKLSFEYKTKYKDRYLEIKYEDLLNSPKDILEKICDHIGLSYEPDLLKWTKASPQTFDMDKEYWKQKALRSIDKTNCKKWVKEMKHGEISFFQQYLGRELKFYGYDIIVDKININSCLEYIRIIFHWSIIVLSNLVLRLKTIILKS
jgi:sulfotransferase family protein